MSTESNKKSGKDAGKKSPANAKAEAKADVDATESSAEEGSITAESVPAVKRPAAAAKKTAARKSAPAKKKAAVKRQSRKTAATGDADVSDAETDDTSGKVDEAKGKKEELADTVEYGEEVDSAAPSEVSGGDEKIDAGEGAAEPADKDGNEGRPRRRRNKKPEEPKEDKEPEEPPVPVPDLIDLNEFQKKPLAEMHRLASDIGLRVAGVRSKHQLVYELLSWFSRKGAKLEATGLLDFAGDSHGFLRWPAMSFASNADDVYCAANFVREHKLKPGHMVKAVVRAPRDREKFLSVDSLLEIEGIPADQWQTPVDFDDLTALFPSERLILEYPDCPSASPRVVDLLAPLGKGQRGLIVAPPRAGKTILLKNIAVSIQKNHPEVELIVLLLDERPEEVTDFRETVDAPVFSSTFDEPSRRHVQVADMVAERARRLVEQKKDVVILLDSLTRLARGHNANIGKGGGRTGSGGLDTTALQRPRKFFGAARNVEEGGSLTILATCLVETDSRMDEVIFEEFKGTGNMEIYLDRELAEKRVFPAIHTLKSGTRKDELLYHPDEFKRISSLRRQLVQLPAGEAMEVLIKNIKLTGSNAELLLRSLTMR